MKATPQRRQCSQGAERLPPTGAWSPDMLAQWDGGAAETIERCDAPTTLAEPGLATRIATSAARSESQDFIARIGAFRRDLGIEPSDSKRDYGYPYAMRRVRFGQ